MYEELIINTGRPVTELGFFDEDNYEKLMPPTKRIVGEGYESVAALLREKTLRMRRTEENIKAANDFIKEMAAESLTLRTTLYNATRDNETKEATINELNGKLRDLEEGAKSALSEIQGLKDQLSKLESYKAEAQTETAELNSAIAGLRADIETKTSEFNELNQRYQAAVAQINQLNQNIVQNNTIIEENKKQLAGANEEITKAQAALVKLQEELNQTKREYRELRASYDQGIKDYDMVSGSLVAVRGEKETLQKNLNEASEALRTEQTENARLRAENRTISEDHNRLDRDYKIVRGENEKNKKENARLLEQYDEAVLKIDTLREGNKLQQDRIVALVDDIKKRKANEKIRDELINDLSRQAKESEDLRNRLTTVTTDLNNTIVSRDQAIATAVEQENHRLQRQHEKAINKLNKDHEADLFKLGSNIEVLQSKLDVANNAKLLALNEQQRKHITNIDKINSKHAAELADLNKTLFEQENLREAAVQEKIALEKEIKAKINEKEKLIDQLKRQKDELKDAQAALKQLKDKFGEQDLLQKQIANYEEQKIELENEIKVHKDNLSKLRKADKQLDSSPPSGFDFFGPAPVRQSRPRRTNANSFFPPPSYSFPPPSYYSPPPPPPSNNFFPSTSYYNPPPPPNYNPAPPSYLPKWPGDSNKLTLEIKVAGGEGGTRAGLESNLSPVSRPRGDIISKLPFGPYGIEIFQPEKFRKMDTKQDKKKGKKQPTPYQIARSVGKSLFRNLDPLRIRKTSVGTDTTYHALERTPAMFETFGRSTKRRKVTRIY